jgi:superfamily II DNA or RNA helicase
VKIGWNDLASAAQAVRRHEKTAELRRRLKPFVERGEKVLIFTAYRQTLDALAKAMADDGIPAAVYHGSLSRHDKDKAVAAFRDEFP